MPQTTLEVENITKTFTSVRAVDGLSFTARSGSVFGLLGPNGAGKTTTIRMVLDIIDPDSGRVIWKGRTVDVLVQGECDETEHLLEGRTTGMAPEIDGRVLINELADFPVRPGDLVRAKVTQSHAYDLVAKVVARA